MEPKERREVDYLFSIFTVEFLCDSFFSELNIEADITTIALKSIDDKNSFFILFILSS